MTAEGITSSGVPNWAIDPAEIIPVIDKFIVEFVEHADASGVVVGLSGGIDSAVSASLAAHALGAHRVLGVFLPYRTSSPASLNDARSVAGHLGINSEMHEITPLVDAWLADQPEADRIRQGNVMARMRMVILYDLSARDNSLVLGTGNRSEALLGYTTLYGDSACALNPLGRLYKTEIRLLAADLGLPEAVILKPPSADLWVGQADEDELGFTYAEADQLLHHLIDEGLGEKQIEALGIAPDLTRRIQERVQGMAFKRRMPPLAPIAGRTDGT